MEEEKNTPEKNPSPEAPKELIDVKEIDELTTVHERVIASLSYIGFLAIIPFYLNRKSKFCRFHGKQGIILAIIFFFAKPLMVLDIIDDIAKLTQIALFVYMGLAALSGKWKKLPFIYNSACELEKTLSVHPKSPSEESGETTV